MIKEKKIDVVLIAYGITLMSMLCFLYNKVPAINRIRYIYVFFIASVTIMQKMVIKNKQIFVLMGIFIFHTILFGFYVTPTKLLYRSFISDNGKEMLYFLFFVFFTAHYHQFPSFNEIKK